MSDKKRLRFRATRRAIDDLLRVMSLLRSPRGCPWDREQDHLTLRHHAVEEVYELMDAIEAGDDHEMAEELGDLLLQVVFHCQMAQERGVFDFEKVTRHLVEKLVRRHPHVFGDGKAKTVDAVWSEWEKIKKAEKAGTRHARASALDGIPRHLPALLRAEKLLKKSRKAKLLPAVQGEAKRMTRGAVARELFALVAQAQARGWSAEELLRRETKRQERVFRRRERGGNGRCQATPGGRVSVSTAAGRGFTEQVWLESGFFSGNDAPSQTFPHGRDGPLVRRVACYYIPASWRAAHGHGQLLTKA